MGCAALDCCFGVEFAYIDDLLAVEFERVCEVVVDLVPFSTTEGHYLTSNGYTILVKKR